MSPPRKCTSCFRSWGEQGKHSCLKGSQCSRTPTLGVCRVPEKAPVRGEQDASGRAAETAGAREVIHSILQGAGSSKPAHAPSGTRRSDNKPYKKPMFLACWRHIRKSTDLSPWLRSSLQMPLLLQGTRRAGAGG